MFAVICCSLTASEIDCEVLSYVAQQLLVPPNSAPGPCERIKSKFAYNYDVSYHALQ